MKVCTFGACQSAAPRSLDYLLEDSAADGDVAGEGAFLVDVGTLDGGLRGLEAYQNMIKPLSLATMTGTERGTPKRWPKKANAPLQAPSASKSSRRL